jgi:ubiquinone/menaquinone biosynthesis C-methylase UbiE
MEIKTHYDELIARLPAQARSRGLDDEEIKSFLRGIDLQKTFGGKSLLEVGCGSGNFLADMQERYDTSSFGLDRYDSRHLGREGVNKIPFSRGNAENLPFEDNSFDSVFSYHVFNYIPDKLKAVTEAHRVLKVGGIGIIDLGNYLKPSYDGNESRLENKYISPSFNDILCSFHNNGQLISGARQIIKQGKHDRHANILTIKKDNARHLDFPKLVSFEIDPKNLMARSQY